MQTVAGIPMISLTRWIGHRTVKIGSMKMTEVQSLRPINDDNQLRYIILLIGVILLGIFAPIAIAADVNLSFTETGQFPGGATYAMAKSGTTLYTATGTVVEIWDVTAGSVTPQDYVVWPGTNELRPGKVGEIRFGDYAVGGLFLDGTTLYVGSEAGLDVYDVTNRQNPVLKGSYHKGPYGTLRVIGTRLYATNEFYFYEVKGTHKFTILDVSNPANIQELGSYKIPVKEGTLQRFDISGNYAYLPIVYDIKPGYVFVVNISNPKNPIEFGRIAGTGYAGFSAVQVDETKKILYALEYRSKMHAYDISTPSAPVELGALGVDFEEPLGQASDLKIKGNYAYTSTFYEGISVFDISNPASMKLVAKGSGDGRFGYVHDILLNGDIAYVANMGGGFSLFNIANPTAPKYVTQLDTHGIFYDVRVVGNHAYVAADNEFMVFDVSDPTKPVHTGSVEWARSGLGGVKGNYVFVDDGWRPLAIVDVSDPEKPTIANQYSDHTKVGPIVDNTMYLGKEGQVQILDISNLPAVQKIGSASITTTNAYPPSMAIKDNYLFAGFGFDGVKILDVSNPKNVKEVGAFLQGDRPNRMAVKGNYLYILSDYYMFTYDISNPVRPVKTSQLQHDSWHTGGAYGIGRFEVYKNYVISGEWKGIIAWDISTPATPKAGVRIELPTQGYGEISGFDFGPNDKFYAAASYKGVDVFNVYTGAQPNQAPVLATIANKTVTVGEILSFAVTATDPEGDVLTYSAANLPKNAMFNAGTRKFSWTPGFNQAGIYTVSFSVSDGVLSTSKIATFIIKTVKRGSDRSSKMNTR